MDTTNNADNGENTNPVPQEIIDAYHEGKRGNTLLKIALRANAQAWVIQNIIERFEVSDPDPGELPTGPFDWIRTLTEAGFSPASIKAMILGLFEATDPNLNNYGEYKRREFLMDMEAWRFFTKDEYLRLVEPLTKSHPNDILRYNRQMAYVIGILWGEKPPQEPGSIRDSDQQLEHYKKRYSEIVDKYRAEVLALARRAVNGIYSLHYKEELETLLCLPLESQIRACLRLISNDAQRQAGKCARYRPAELTLLIRVWLAGAQYQRDGERIEWAILNTIAPEHGDRDTFKDDREYPIRVYRYCLGVMATASPPAREKWMDDGRMSPEAILGSARLALDKKLRERLQAARYAFMRAEEKPNPKRGGTRLQAGVEKGQHKETYIHNFPAEPPRDGEEVIVPLTQDGKPLFRADRETGWLTRLHPVRPPDHTMAEEIRKTNKF